MTYREIIDAAIARMSTVVRAETQKFIRPLYAPTPSDPNRVSFFFGGRSLESWSDDGDAVTIRLVGPRQQPIPNSQRTFRKDERAVQYLLDGFRWLETSADSDP